jgi:hypothetical protein
MKAPVLATSHLKGGTWTLGAVAVGLRPNEAAHRAKQTASRGGHGMSGPPFLNRFSIIVPHGNDALNRTIHEHPLRVCRAKKLGQNSGSKMNP